MKSRTRKKYILLLVVLINVILPGFGMVVEVHAWRNTSPTGVNFDVYERSLDNWVSEGHYGTHDWIGDAALDAVLRESSPISKAKWFNGETPFWTTRRRLIFLIGTEAPDEGPTKLRLNLNNEDVYGIGDSPKHHIHFNPNPEDEEDYDDYDRRMKIKIAPVLAEIANYRNLAENCLRDGKCDLAAF